MVRIAVVAARPAIGDLPMTDVAETEDEDLIDVEPTKALFTEMMVRDIPLEQAILDLVDNSVDGAKALRPAEPPNFEGLLVQLELSADGFRIVDNCGGFSRESAKKYAFRFGRPTGSAGVPGSIGQFGVGMKRALFKFGRHFVVRSATDQEKWAVDVDVDEWEEQEGWHFKWSDFGADIAIGEDNPGTEIIVDRLRSEVALRFGTSHFQKALVGLIKSKHRQFISNGLSIAVNSTHVDAASVFLLVGDDIAPAVKEWSISHAGFQDVKVRVVVGMGPSSPTEAGWYVVCNGRVVLEADRRNVTGWGLAETEADSIEIPTFHNQFARFRGIVSFDSQDSAQVPWNTTKTDINPDSSVWLEAYEVMIQMMRPAIDFLNKLNSDIEENTREGSSLLKSLTDARMIKPENLSARPAFLAPRVRVLGPRTVKIQYVKPVTDVDFLKEALDVGSAKAVGERTFDLILAKQKA